jgi:hypothetical protein
VWAEVLGVKVSVSVDKKFGDAQRDEIQTADVLTMLVAAVAEPNHWEPIMPTARVSGVALTSPVPGAATTILLDPVGGLRFSQRTVPLGIRIDKLGTARLANAYRTFAVRAVSATGAALAATDAMAPFATGQFFDLSEDEQFRAPATERYRSGLDIASAEGLVYPANGAVAMSYDYETIPLLGDDDDETDSLPGTLTIPRDVARRWARNSLGPVGRPRNFGYVPPPAPGGSRIVVGPEQYVVASERATAAGVIAETGANGQPMVGTYGELRGAAGGRMVMASYLADPASIGGNG